MFWIAGGVVGGAAQVALWILALGIECLGPMASFYVPGLGRSTTADWKIDGGHMAERCALFVIIALGESILVTGATAASLPAHSANVAAFWWRSSAAWPCGGSISTLVPNGAAMRIARSTDPGRIGRAVYTYFHIPIIAGIVVCAVADEITITHPSGHMSIADALVLLGGPALYLGGNVFFKRASAKYYPLSHLVGLGLLVLLVPVAMLMTPLMLGSRDDHGAHHRRNLGDPLVQGYFLTARLATAPTSASALTGLARCAWNPAASASARSCTREKAVSAIAGRRCESNPAARRLRNNW